MKQLQQDILDSTLTTFGINAFDTELVRNMLKHILKDKKYVFVDDDSLVEKMSKIYDYIIINIDGNYKNYKQIRNLKRTQTNSKIIFITHVYFSISNNRYEIPKQQLLYSSDVVGTVVANKLNIYKNRFGKNKNVDLSIFNKRLILNNKLQKIKKI